MAPRGIHARDEPAPPARYAGRVAGADLTLTVSVTDVAQTLGRHRLVRGGAEVTARCV